MLLAAADRHLATVGGEDTVLVACSGGIDSVVLSDVAVDRLGCRRVIVAHIDHGVRSSSGADAAFVADLAARLGVEHVSTRLPVGPADEATLRKARYQALEAHRVATGASWILTAHNADDQAETVLLGLLRSTTPAALRGIPRRRDRIVRPLIDVRRAVITAYATGHGLGWVDDPTNVEPRYLRNRIRKELLPLLEARYRKGIAGRLVALSEAMSGIERPAPTNTPPPPRVDLTDEHGIQLSVGPYAGEPYGDGKRMALFDADALSAPVIRRVRPGDRIRPFGMDGRRKLQDVLVDAKIPKDARRHVLVVASSEGHVLWVPGLLRSADAPVSGQTRRVWTLRAEPAVDVGSTRPCDREPDRSM